MNKRKYLILVTKVIAEAPKDQSEPNQMVLLLLSVHLQKVTYDSLQADMNYKNQNKVLGAACIPLRLEL